MNSGMYGENAPETNGLAETPLTGHRVLVCEDEIVARRHIRLILASAGLEVIGSARDGAEAVEMALRDRPSLILLDIRMPRMDGFEAMERIFAVYQPCVVVVSAYDKAIQAQAIDRGAHGYITKPVNSDSLLYDLEAAVQMC